MYILLYYFTNTSEYHTRSDIDHCNSFTKIRGGALGLGVSQDNFTSTRSVGTFLTKFTSIVAALFIICSIAIVAISRDELRETQSVLEKEEEENSNLPQIPQSK